MPPSRRVRALIDGLSWAEKLGQLQIVFRPSLDDAMQLVRNGIGSVFWPRSAVAVNALQRVAVEETRLGIPVLVGLDVVHGHRTTAPIPLAQAALKDVPTWGIAVFACAVLFLWRSRAAIPVVILGAGLVGMLLLRS